MAKIDLDDVRQFIMGDEIIKEYFLSLARKESPASTDGNAAQLMREISTLKASLDNALATNHALEKSIQAENSDNDALRKKLDDALQNVSELERELAQARKNAAQAEAEKKASDEKLAEFETISSARELYDSLGEKTKGAMRNIFRASSPDGFISCGAQKDSLANLWDYGRTLAVDGSADCPKIDRLFGYFVSLYNLTFAQPVYELIEPQPGDRFDEDIHVCLTRGMRISNISGTLLRGYRINGKTVNKALVK